MRRYRAHVRKAGLLAVLSAALVCYSVWTHDRSVPSDAASLPRQLYAKEWSSTREMSADENAEHHFEKHGDEFGFTSEDQYIRAANDFVGSPPEGTLTAKQTDGDTVYFNPATDWFAVVSYKGQIRTFYKLDPKIHGFKSNTEYFNAQARRK